MLSEKGDTYFLSLQGVSKFDSVKSIWKLSDKLISSPVRDMQFYGRITWAGISNSSKIEKLIGNSTIQVKVINVNVAIHHGFPTLGKTETAAGNVL